MTITQDDILKYLEQCNMLQLSELVKKIEDRFGVTAAVPVATQVVVEENIKKEEQMEFDVILESFGDRKIQVIKTVREITTLGLKESKVLVDGAPKTITEGVSEKVAEEIKIKLEKAGATVFIK